MANLTDADLSRLFSLQYVHGGSLVNTPYGIGSSFEALKTAGLILIDTESAVIDLAEITPKGRAVVETMLRAGREVLSGK
jgi:hypothetical protein